MTKQILAILLFVNFVIAGTQAQSQFVPEWNFGVGFGPTFSSVSFTQPTVATKSFNQYHGGISARYISQKNLGIIGELNFSQQGWEGLYKNNPEYSHSRTLNYIEMPVLTHIYFGNKVRFFVNLGPKIQYLISENEKMSDALADAIANNIGNTSTPQYNRNVERKFDYGIIGGMGVEFRSKIGNFALEGRYYLGLGDIYDTRRSDDNFSRAANRVISARLSYYIKIF